MKTAAVLGLFLLLLTRPSLAQDFSFQPAGALVQGSGQGCTDTTVFAPGIRFPIETAPAFANSQVWGHGGISGPGGGQCDSENYAYPWFDTFCETRSWDTPLCPTGQGHQGVDVRPSTCEKNVHWAVAVDDGTISHIGSYIVSLTNAQSTQFNYLHMEPSSVAVSVGQAVHRGQRLGRVSNAFGSTQTTIHLHFEVVQNVGGIGITHVPGYTSLVQAYETLLGVPEQPCALIPSEGLILDDSGPCMRLHGPAASWRLVTDEGWQSSLHWTYAFDSATPGNWAEWLLHFAQAGRYSLEVYLLSDYAQSQSVRYRVHHQGEDTDLVLDQSQSTGWVSLGTFDFAQGGAQTLSVFDNTGEDLTAKRRIMVDALRITAEPKDAGPLEAGQQQPLPDASLDQQVPALDAAPQKDSPGPDDEETGIVSGSLHTESSCTYAPHTDARPKALTALSLLLLAGLARRKRLRASQ